MVHATRISLSIGLVSVFLSLILGVSLGGLSGYYGGRVDMAIQRMIEFLDAIPSLPLWMGFSAAIPLTWPPLWVYFAMTVILSLIGWTGMARVVRGRFLSLREEDFVMSARIDSAKQMNIRLEYAKQPIRFATHEKPQLVALGRVDCEDAA